MKNLFLSLTFGLVFSVATFAGNKNETKKSAETKPKTEKSSKSELPPQTEWRYTCSDGKVTEFTCGCTQAQATAMGRAWCNARSAVADAN